MTPSRVGLSLQQKSERNSCFTQNTGSLHGEVANVLDCDVEVNEFEDQ